MQALFGACGRLPARRLRHQGSGRAGHGGGSAAAIVTDSDETNARKRARLRIELAIGYFEQGQTTVALDEIKQALAADPTFADAYNLRGLIYMRLDDCGQAEDSFRRAHRAEPARAERPAQLRLAAVPAEPLRRRAAAVLGRRWPIPIYADRAKTLMTQGVCQLRAGQRAEAERSLTQAYELDAGNPVIGYNLASLLCQRERLVARAVLHPPRQQQPVGQCRDAVARHQDRTPAEQPRGDARNWPTSCSGASPSRGRRLRTSAGISMIERASEFGASAAVPLVAGDSTHMTAGDMLRQAREAHGLHIDMVAAALKVPAQKLEALEADDIEPAARCGVRARAGRQRLPRAEDRSGAGAGQAAGRAARRGWRKPTAPSARSLRSRGAALGRRRCRAGRCLSRPLLIVVRAAAGRRCGAVLAAAIGLRPASAHRSSQPDRAASRADASGRVAVARADGPRARRAGTGGRRRSLPRGSARRAAAAPADAAPAAAPASPPAAAPPAAMPATT